MKINYRKGSNPSKSGGKSPMGHTPFKQREMLNDQEALSAEKANDPCTKVNGPTHEHGSRNPTKHPFFYKRELMLLIYRSIPLHVSISVN